MLTEIYEDGGVVQKGSVIHMVVAALVGVVASPTLFGFFALSSVPALPSPLTILDFVDTEASMHPV
jgi:hypothetical protein